MVSRVIFQLEKKCCNFISDFNGEANMKCGSELVIVRQHVNSLAATEMATAARQ